MKQAHRRYRWGKLPPAIIHWSSFLHYYASECQCQTGGIIPRYNQLSYHSLTYEQPLMSHTLPLSPQISAEPKVIKNGESGSISDHGQLFLASKKEGQTGVQ